MNIEKLHKYGMEKAKYFKHVADPVVKDMFEGSEEDMKINSFLSATYMAIGAKIKRNEHIGIGVVIGTLGTIGTLTLIVKGDELLKRRDTDKEQGE